MYIAYFKKKNHFLVKKMTLKPVNIYIVKQK